MKSHYQSGWFPFFWRTALLVTASVLLPAIRSFGGSEYASWDRQVADGMEPGVPFILVSTSSIDERLSAGCGYQYLEKKGTVTLHGTKDDPNGDFSPFVTYEIATEGRGKWKTIGKSTQIQNPATIEITPTKRRVLLHVDMEPFRSTIGKFRWGRLVLENGDAAPFQIDDLLPAGNSPDAGAGNFKQDITDLHPSRFGSSFSLVKVTSLSKHLVGDFVFIGGQNRSITEIKGNKTLDEDFWPSVTLQAGNSDKDWQTLGKSVNEGIATSLKVVHEGPLTPLRVVLDAYKSDIGKFTYGKIIFSGGEFAVFEVADLKPTSGRR